MANTVSVRVGLACAFAMIALSATGARAEEGVAIKSLLGSIGILPPEKDPIRYRERAPLVIPPKMELRAPASADSYASNQPNWPKDPDVMARRRAAAERSVPMADSEIRRMSEQNPRLTIDEMRAGRSPTGGGGPGRHVSDRDGVWISPTELARGAKPAEDDNDSAPVARRTLADPPNAYRQASRGGKVTESFSGKVDQQTVDSNPINWLTCKFSRSSDDD